MQKTGKQRRMRRIKQTPSRMILFEQIESEVIQLKYPLYARQRLSWRKLLINAFALSGNFSFGPNC
ncbi:MAG: hypothetical protein BVN35_16265 [Proteobacteria bacterium ST_bin11]|nr:MAG: hypothetical protein BVN35_16265 [Proteobacteria bacterium ST_bin11]